MKQIVRYETSDGRMFEDSKTALEHEDLCLILDSMLTSQFFANSEAPFVAIKRWMDSLSTQTDTQRALLRAAKIDCDKLKAEDICKGNENT